MTAQDSNIHDAALEDRLVSSTVAALELLSIHLGRRLGLYAALDTPRTVDGLAAAAGIDVRYAREWLEQQAVAGFIEVDEPSAAWNERVYGLAPAQRAAFVEAESPLHVSPLADMIAGVAGVTDLVAEAYATGAGVPYAAYGTVFRDGQAGVNRPAFRHHLAAWVGALPDVARRLGDGGSIADLGCGAGWSTIALATAFPRASVIGYDSDASSIADAEANAAETGSTARFSAVDAGDLIGDGPFDLIVILEALHDMSRPGEVLEAARAALGDGGAVLIADEKVADSFAPRGAELERMMYGWSVVHCLPASLADVPSAAIGTVIRRDVIEALAAEADFSCVEVSDIDAGFFRLYGLRP